MLPHSKGTNMRACFKNATLLIALLIATATVSYSQDPDEGSEAAAKGDYAQAYRHWKPLAEQGNVFTQYNLGLLY